jgi:hypothetical protein
MNLYYNAIDWFSIIYHYDVLLKQFPSNDTADDMNCFMHYKNWWWSLSNQTIDGETK